MRYLRQNKIIEIIENNDVDTQEKLASMLKDEGFGVTQATISRDIKELQLVKTLSADGKYRYTVNHSSDLPLKERFEKILKHTVVSIESAENIIVIKTLSGCGNAAGEAVDTSGIAHIVGSIAGDNTLFVAVDQKANVPAIIQEFNRILKGND